MKLSLINGQDATLSVNHRGLAFGDGLFETCLVDHQKIYFLDAHLARMNKGVAALNLHFSEQQQSMLKQDLVRLTNLIDEPHVLKVMLLRTAPGRGYDFDPARQGVDAIIQLNPYLKPNWCSGAALIESTIPVTENAYLAGLKHLNRLDSVLARQQARSAGVHDALMSTQDGHVIESTMANVFFKLDGQWQTPILKTAGVDGIIRQQLLHSFSSQIIERHIDRATLAQVESAFITNSLMGIVPINELSHRTLKLCPTISHFSDSLRQLRD